MDKSKATYDDLAAFLDEIDNEVPDDATSTKSFANTARALPSSPLPSFDPPPPSAEDYGLLSPKSGDHAVSLGLTDEEYRLLHGSSAAPSAIGYAEIDLTTPRGIKLENDNLRIKVQLYESQKDNLEMRVKELELRNMQLESELKRAQSSRPSAKSSLASGNASGGISEGLYNETLERLRRAEEESDALRSQVASFMATEGNLQDALAAAHTDHAAAEKELTATLEQLSERMQQLGDTVSYADGLREELELERERAMEFEIELIRLAPLKEGLGDVHERWLDAEEKVRYLTEELAKSKSETESAQSKLTKIMNLPGLDKFNASGIVDDDKKSKESKKGSHSRTPSHTRGPSSGSSSSSQMKASASSSSSGVTLREGWLERWANKKLQKRYFVLKPTFIYSYKNEKADREKPLGQMDITLAQITILEEPDAVKLCNEKYVFKILDPTSLNSFVLVGPSEKEIKEWTDQLWKLNKAAQMSGASKPRPTSMKLSAPLVVSAASAGDAALSPTPSATPLSPSLQEPPESAKGSGGDDRKEKAEEKREKRKSVFKRLSSKSKIGRNTINSEKDLEDKK